MVLVFQTQQNESLGITQTSFCPTLESHLICFYSFPTIIGQISYEIRRECEYLGKSTDDRFTESVFGLCVFVGCVRVCSCLCVSVCVFVSVACDASVDVAGTLQERYEVMSYVRLER